MSTEPKSLNDFAQEVHVANHKWWHDIHTGERLTRNFNELLMLVVSELAEAMEGERKNLQDDKLPHRKMAEVEMADVLIRCLDLAAGFNLPLKFIEPSEVPTPKDNKAEALLVVTTAVVMLGALREYCKEAGMTDASAESQGAQLSRIIALTCAYCGKFGYDIWGAYHQKMEFNQTRADHTHEARKAANGKKF